MAAEVDAPTFTRVLPSKTVISSLLGRFNIFRILASLFLSELLSMEIWILFREKNAVSEAEKKALHMVRMIKITTSVPISTRIITPL